MWNVYSIGITIYMLIYFQNVSAAGKRHDVPSVPSGGSQQLSINKVSVCKGPKRKDCCKATVELDQNTNLTFHMLVEQNIKGLKGRIVAISNGVEIARFQMTNICDSLFFGTIFKNYLNVTDNCILFKGDYLTRVDVVEINKLYNPAIYTPIFGDITLKAVVFGDSCNFICLLLDVSPRKV